MCNLNYSVSKKQPKKLNKRRKFNKKKNNNNNNSIKLKKKVIKLNKFYPRKLNIMYGIIIIIISYFLKVLLCPRLNWVNY